MPEFRPFPAVRYAAGCDLDAVLAPPYDVLSDADVVALHGRDAHNITHVDVPEGQDYAQAGRILRDWLAAGVLMADSTETLTIYRMSFVDASGAAREIVGVLGGLEVVDDVAGADNSRTTYGRSGRTTVLPHERTTPKATTDRLDLMRATSANTSPVWGLSLASGLTEALRRPGEPLGSVVVDGVVHAVERVSDPDRIAAIQAIIAADDVLIADGHHRYSVSRTYRDQVRAATGSADSAAEQTLTFVNELVDDQLSIEAIHRLYAGVAPEVLRSGLAGCFDFEPLGEVSPATLAEMRALGRLVLLWPDGSAEWLVAKPGVFDDVRGLDGVWLETALAGVAVETTYQHGLSEMISVVASGQYAAGVLIRPTSIQEIRRTAREGLLMPPKSTFFTPKLLTGWVIRPTEPLPAIADTESVY